MVISRQPQPCPAVEIWPGMPGGRGPWRLACVLPKGHDGDHLADPEEINQTNEQQEATP